MKSRALFSISILIALLIAFLPIGSTNAIGNTQRQKSEQTITTQASLRASRIADSLLDFTNPKTATSDLTLPAAFAQVFTDSADGAMVFMLNGPGPSMPLSNYVTDNNYGGFNLAMIDLPSGQYLYAWSRFGAGSFADIEYTIISHDGMNLDLPITKLTDNLGADGTNDWVPSLAVLPNGTIGIAWQRHLSASISNTNNDNIYFATLSSTGSLLSGPINLTNNSLWGAHGDITVPHLETPSIAATEDNHFIVSWDENRNVGNISISNVWYTVLDSSGSTVYAPTQFTSDNSSILPVLNPLKDGNAILTWDSSNIAYYAILNGSGAIVKPSTLLNHTGFYPPFSDSVKLPNGNIAVASATSSGVVLTILDDQYNKIAGPTSVSVPNASILFELSATYDSSNHIILTWIDGDFYPITNMYFALADNTGAFLIDPMIFKSSADGLETNFYGQGNAPYINQPATLQISIDIKPGSMTNPINTKSKGIIPVAIFSTSNFNAMAAVDTSALTFGNTGDEKSLASCNSVGSDVNADGLLDLICNFYTQGTGFNLGDTTGFLKGKTIDQVSLEGSDIIKTLK